MMRTRTMGLVGLLMVFSCLCKGYAADSPTNLVNSTISLSRGSSALPDWARSFVSDSLRIWQGRLFDANRGQADYPSEEELGIYDFEKGFNSITDLGSRRQRANAMAKALSIYRVRVENAVKAMPNNPKATVFEVNGSARILMGNPWMSFSVGDTSSEAKIYAIYRMPAGKNADGTQLFQSVVVKTKSLELDDLLQAELRPVEEAAVISTEDLYFKRRALWNLLAEMEDRSGASSTWVRSLEETVKALQEKLTKIQAVSPEVVAQVQKLKEALIGAKSQSEITEVSSALVDIAEKADKDTDARMDESFSVFLAMNGIVKSAASNQEAIENDDDSEEVKASESPETKPETNKTSKILFVAKEENGSLVLVPTADGPKFETQVIVKDLFKIQPTKTWSFEDYAKANPELKGANDPFSQHTSATRLIEKLKTIEATLKKVSEASVPKK